MNKVNEIIDDIILKFNIKSMSQHPKLRELSAKVNIKPEKIVLILILLLSIILLSTRFGISILLLLFTLLIPSLYSYKAIKSKGLNDDKKWLTYWMVFGLFYTCKCLLLLLINNRKLIDLIFIAVSIYIYFPKLDGYKVVYDNFINKIFETLEFKFDTIISKIENKIKSN